MANMAIDSWLPHRFAALSERLTMQNGVLLMGGASIAALLYTHGDVAKLVVMYSINVFLTFSLSELRDGRFWIQHRKEHQGLVAAPAGPPHRPDAVRDDPRVTVDREVRRGRLAHAGRSPGSSSPSASASSATTTASSPPSAASTSSCPTRWPTSERAQAQRREPGRRGGEGTIDRRQPGRGPLRRRLRRPRAARAAHAPPDVPAPLQGRRLLSVAVVDSDVFKGIERGRRAREAHAAGARQVRPVRRAGSASPPRARSRRHRGRRRGRGARRPT